MKMLEIEIKAYCPEHGPIVEKITALGATFKERRHELDRYFNHPSRDFKETDEALRIRRAANRNILTYKGPKIGTAAKSREEVEVEVKNFEEMRSILLKLGFQEAGRVSKVRDLYCWKDLKIYLDQVEALGNFVEIEKKGVDRLTIERELLSLAKDLGLNRLERRSYLELLSV